MDPITKPFRMSRIVAGIPQRLARLARPALDWATGIALQIRSWIRPNRLTLRSRNRWWRSRSVGLKLTLLVAAVVAGLLGTLLAGGYIFWRGTLRKEIAARLNSVAESRRDMVQAHLGQLRQRAELNSTRGELLGYLLEFTDQPDTDNRHWSQLHLTRMVDGDSVLAARLADLQGRVQIAADPAEAGMDVGDEPAFQAGLVESYVSPPVRSGRRFQSVISAPVRRFESGRLAVGVLLLTVDVTPLATALVDTTGLGQTGEVLLGMRENGNIRYIFPPRYRTETLALPMDKAPAMAAAIEGQERMARNPDYRGEPVLAAGRPIGYGNWGLVAKMDEREAYAPITRAGRYAVLLGAIVGLAGLGAAALVARGFTRPLRQLAAGAHRVATRDYDTPVPAEGEDELGMLAVRFNEMTAAIRARRAERDASEAALQASEARLATVVENLSEGLVIGDIHGTVFHWNPAALEMHGYGSLEECRRFLAEFVGTFELRSIGGRVLPFEEWPMPLIISGRVLRDYVVRLRRLDQDWEKIVVYSGSMVRSAGGEMLAFLSITDNTERIQAELQLEQSLKDLREAQAELVRRERLATLGQLAGSVAHELRTPLGVIRNGTFYLNMVMPKGDDELSQIVAEIERAVGNSDHIIGEMLDFVREAPGMTESFPVGDAIARALMLVPIPGNISLRSPAAGEGPVVHATLDQITRIFINLIQNGVQAMPDGGELEITEINVDGQRVCVQVRDTGCGIPEENLTKVFEPLFTTKTKGIGLGLAISRRYAILNGGDLSVESGTGTGTIFRLILVSAG